MEKRGFKFTTPTARITYNTAEQGWTLTSWEFTEPELIENYIDVPGRLDGPLDGSTALTNGDPRYGPRKLTATFEKSDGARSSREAEISYMKSVLDGLRQRIIFPDDPHRYVNGRIRVERLYNDLAHASVRVTATCEPWRYSYTSGYRLLTATTDEAEEELENRGRRLVIPTITVSEGDVQIEGHGSSGVYDYEHTLSSTALSAGTYQVPDFCIPPLGTFYLKYSGSGTIILTWGEADL